MYNRIGILDFKFTGTHSMCTPACSLHLLIWRKRFVCQKSKFWFALRYISTWLASKVIMLKCWQNKLDYIYIPRYGKMDLSELREEKSIRFHAWIWLDSQSNIELVAKSRFIQILLTNLPFSVDVLMEIQNQVTEATSTSNWNPYWKKNYCDGA